ncbi:MAG TPA: hypothetical protein PLZ42_01840 [Methanothrix sp.]|nr:hypothetical protein [Methanothrix sp.]
MCETKTTRIIDCDGEEAPSLKSFLALEEGIRRRSDRIGALLLIEVVRAGPDGMECDRFDREDPLPFRIDPPCGSSPAATWHLTLTYGGPLGDALGARARWLETGEVAAECVIDTLGLAEALASGRLTAFFRETADWLASEVRPRGLATADRIGEAASLSRDLSVDLQRWQGLARGRKMDEETGGDGDLRS